MNEQQFDQFEERLRETAAAFDYPPTPDLARLVRERLAEPPPRSHPARRRALAIALLLAVIIAGATAIPPVRAALIDILRVGAIELGLLEAAETSVPAQRAPISIIDLGQEITFDKAADFVTPRDPAYPPALGRPDAVYGQNLLYREPVVTFLWDAAADRPQVTLTQIEIPDFAFKWASGEQVSEVEVLGQTAVWIEGPHRFDLVQGGIDQGTVMASNVLIWSDGGITYRLEGNFSLAEALRITESWE